MCYRVRLQIHMVAYWDGRFHDLASVYLHPVVIQIREYIQDVGRQPDIKVKKNVYGLHEREHM